MGGVNKQKDENPALCTERVVTQIVYTEIENPKSMMVGGPVQRVPTDHVQYFAPCLKGKCPAWNHKYDNCEKVWAQLNTVRTIQEGIGGKD